MFPPCSGGRTDSSYWALQKDRQLRSIELSSVLACSRYARLCLILRIPIRRPVVLVLSYHRLLWGPRACVAVVTCI
jgi:hypothetical protein